MKKKKLGAFMGGVVFVLATCAGAYYLLQPEATRGLSVVANYKWDGICMAITPECGYCPGKTIDKKCYVNPDNLTDAEKANIKY